MRQKFSIQKLFSISRSIRLPSICVLCSQFHKGKLAVCSPCIELLIPLGPACQHCAWPLPESSHLICGTCIKNPPSFDRAYIAWQFEEPLRSLIHRFKYNKGLFLGSFLSHLMSHAFTNNETSPPCLIPVPMHPERIRQRGFNQAAVLTRLLAKQFGLPHDLTTCKKIINTTPQVSLNKEQRQKNLRATFQTSPLPWQHVILIDDLLTTGSTANELALTLKKSGVHRVDIWCCARVVYNHKP